MTKHFFVILFLVLFLNPSTSENTYRKNLIQLLLFSGFDKNVVKNCDQTCLEEKLFNDSTNINLTNLFIFETLNVTEVLEDGRTLGLNQFRSFLASFRNRQSNEDNSTDINSTNNQRFIDFTQCGVYPACVINALPGNLWSFTCDRPIVVFIAVIGILLSVIIVVSNILIIVVTLSSKSLRKPHGYFKLSLAMADLIAGAFVLPSIIHNSLTSIDYERQVYTPPEVAIFASVDETPSAEASFFGVMGVISTITAVLSLLVLSIDSFLSVKWPMQYRIGDIVTSKKAILVVAFIWIASLLLGFLPLLADNVVVYGLSSFTFQYIPILKEIKGTKDGDSFLTRYPHAFAYVIIVWGVPFVITWILTILTSVQSRKMLKNMKEARRRSVRSEKALNKVDRNLIRTVVVVLVLFTITILPVFIVGIATVAAPTGECNTPALALAFFFSTYVLICGRFLNVIIYNVFNKEFRTAFTSFVTNVLCCRRVVYAGLPQKSTSAGRTRKSRASSTDKSLAKDTEVTTRSTSGSISASTATERTLTSPTDGISYKYSVSGEPEAGSGALYTNSAFTINEAEEK